MTALAVLWLWFSVKQVYIECMKLLFKRNIWIVLLDVNLVESGDFVVVVRSRTTTPCTTLALEVV